MSDSGSEELKRFDARLVNRARETTDQARDNLIRESRLHVDQMADQLLRILAAERDHPSIGYEKYDN